MSMYITCLDLEGVLVPEIWIAFAEATGIPELKRTTRDEPDYDKLMKYRINILKEHGLGLKEIQDTIAKIGYQTPRDTPMPDNPRLQRSHRLKIQPDTLIYLLILLFLWRHCFAQMRSAQGHLLSVS